MTNIKDLLSKYNSLFEIYNSYQSNLDISLKGSSLDQCNQIYYEMQKIDNLIKKMSDKNMSDKNISYKNRPITRTSPRQSPSPSPSPRKRTRSMTRIRPRPRARPRPRPRARPMTMTRIRTRTKQ